MFCIPSNPLHTMFVLLKSMGKPICDVILLKDSSIQNMESKLLNATHFLFEHFTTSPPIVQI